MFKRLFVCFVVFLFFLNISCKKQEPFVDAAFVFLKWASAVKNLNYKDYSECEAFPKDQDVCKTLYKDFYYSDLITRNIEQFHEGQYKTDIEGYKYNYKNVYFECKRVARESGKVIENMKGEVEFIKYINGPKVDKGWLMHNRTFIRIGFGD